MLEVSSFFYNRVGILNSKLLLPTGDIPKNCKTIKYNAQEETTTKRPRRAVVIRCWAISSLLLSPPEDIQSIPPQRSWINVQREAPIRSAPIRAEKNLAKIAGVSSGFCLAKPVITGLVIGSTANIIIRVLVELLRDLRYPGPESYL